MAMSAYVRVLGSVLGLCMYVCVCDIHCLYQFVFWNFDGFMSSPNLADSVCMLHRPH